MTAWLNLDVGMLFSMACHNTGTAAVTRWSNHSTIQACLQVTAELINIIHSSQITQTFKHRSQGQHATDVRHDDPYISFQRGPAVEHRMLQFLAISVTLSRTVASWLNALLHS